MERKSKIEHLLPEEIEKRSFEIITEELGDTKLIPGTEPIVKRCIHTSADFDYAQNLCFSEDVVEKDVHWYLMRSESYYSKPQREEHFIDSGYYKYHEAYHLLKFANERTMLERAYEEYLNLKKANLWGGSKKYFKGKD